MKTLDLARFQKGRESILEAGGFKFTIRRPSDLDVAKAGSAGALISMDFATRYIVGWEDVLESDLLPGGDPEPVAFAPDLFSAWVADRPDLWMPISEGVFDAYKRHEEATEARGNA